MRETTIGQLLLENALPPESYQPGTELNKKGVKKLFQHLANNHPDQYRHIAQRLNEVGSTAAYMEGTSFDIDDFKTPGIVLEARHRIRKKLARVLSNPTFTPKQRNDKIIEVVGDESNKLLNAIVDNNRSNPLTEQILSGARGNAVALKRLIGGDLLYLNHRDEPIPLVVESSYSEGLKPAEYWAATYGARKGLAEGKLGVGKGGYLSKLLNQLSHKLMVTAIDSPDEMPEGAVRGLPVDIDDNDNIGALLAENIGGHKRNTIITPKVLADIKKTGRDTLLIRSPLVGGPPDGGLYARDVGIRELGRLADLGSLPGLTAAQAAGERLSQVALCLDQDTEVRMADWSVKKIKDITPGEYVLGCSVAGVIKPSKVINKYVNGTKECFKTVFRLGTGRSQPSNMLEVVSTLDHKILAVLHTRKDPRPDAVITTVKRPATNGRFYAKLSQAYDDTDCIEEPFALAIGLLIGDGCYNGGISSGGIELSCWDNTLILDIAEYFIGLGCYLKEQSSYGHYRVSDINGGKNIGSYSGIRNPIKKKLAELGLWGSKSYEKKLPDTTKWTNKSVANLVAGLWATDGWVSISKAGRVQLGYASSSRQLVEQLRLVLMLRFGIYVSAITTKRKKRKDGTYYRDNYQLSINGLENIQRFAININNIPGVKGPKLRELIGYINSVKTNKALESGRCAFVSQESVGELTTYDLEVDNADHLFVLANGLIVSNSSKHAGGVAGGAKTIGGFPAIEQMINVPKHYKDGATHAQVDGVVSNIEENPLGGWHVFVGNEQHFVAPGLNPIVKKGDNVEAGDMISEGLPNPSEFVKHKGIGEGSRQFVKHFMEVFKGAGMPANRRNIELLTRGFINHVEFDEDYENWLPGDVTSYSGIERNWRVRDRSQLVKPSSAINKYLETPVLHYTIGTRITPSVLSNLNKYGIKQVTVHDDPPPFSPLVVRGSASVSYDDNWLTRLLGSQQQKVLLTAARQGDVADMNSLSYVPAKAQGESFGKDWPNKLLSDYK